MATNLSPYQVALQNLGSGATAAQIGQVADGYFGAAPVTPGSTITYQDPTTVIWTDPNGYQHTSTRSLDGTDPNVGIWRDNTNAPPVTPNAAQEGVTNAVGTAVQNYLTGTPTLPQLPSAVQGELNTISQNEIAQNNQQLQQLQGSLVAQLYGQGMNRSTVANDAAGRFAQYAGLVQDQQQANAANRTLSLQQFLAQQAAQQGQVGASLYGNLTGQNTQMSIADAADTLAQQQLQQQQNQWAQNYLLQQQNLDFNEQQITNPLNKFLNSLSGIGSVLGGVGGLISGINATSNKSGGGGASSGGSSSTPAPYTYPSISTDPTLIDSPLGDGYGLGASIYSTPLIYG